MDSAANASPLLFRMLLEGLSRADLAGLTGRRLIRCVAAATHSLSAAWILHLELDGQRALEFSTEPTVIGGWDEVGRLRVKESQARWPSEPSYPTREWRISEFEVKSCAVLVYADERATVESGLIFRSTLGEQLIIVSGIPPGSVSTLLEADAQEFKPEFPIDYYEGYDLEQNAV